MKFFDYVKIKWEEASKWVEAFFASEDEIKDKRTIDLLSKNYSEDEDFISDSKTALLTKTTPWAHRVINVIALFFFVALIWAYFASIDVVTVAEGKVIPSSEVKIIQSLDGGIIAKIDVDEGAIVKKDQPLVHLDDTRYKADYETGVVKYYPLLAMVSRLTAEAQGKDKIDFPDVLKHSHDDLISRENELFQERKDNYSKELAVLQESYKLANDEVGMDKPLVDKGIVSRVDLLRAERSANAIQTNILDLQKKYREDALTDLNQHKSELASLEENLISLKDKMVHTTITSPVYGVVKKLYIVTVGGVVRPGEPIMDVVPLADTLLIQARVRPSDIAFIQLGQSATVKITAYDYSIYGSLEGKVEYVSADAIEEHSADRVVSSYYLVNVRTQKNYFGTEKNKFPIIPGMMATVHIATDKKTVLQYLLKPIIKAKQEALRER